MQIKFREILARFKLQRQKGVRNKVMKVIRANERQFVPAGHENPERPGVYKKVLAVKDELFAGRVQMVNWARLPADAAFRRHFHEDMEEIFIIIRGRAEARVESSTVTLEAGDTIIISPREAHEMRALSGQPVEYIVVGISGTENGRTVVTD